MGGAQLRVRVLGVSRGELGPLHHLRPNPVLEPGHVSAVVFIPRKSRAAYQALRLRTPAVTDHNCAELHARVEMLQAEARDGVAEALERGPAWEDFAEQLSIAAFCGRLAEKVEERIAEEC